jgi:3-oxoisoapionate decarboxylase
MTRRTFVSALAAATATHALAAPPRAKMGVASTCFMTVRRPRDFFEFMNYCDSLGAGGVQAGLANTEPEYLGRVRQRAEQVGLYLEVMAGLPAADSAAFERTLVAGKQIGARCARVGCLSGRRYETFSSLDDWKQFVAKSKDSLQRAVPLAEKHKIPLALENHKDWTVDEHVALLKEYSSDYLGACIDTGNNISLLDDPYEVVQKLAPFAVATHVKDMGVAEYKDGFLLSEMPLGAGFLDMQKIVETIHASRPATPITLEMITRNPLEVPCLTEKYWATFPHRNGALLARTMHMVKTHAQALPRMDPLPQVAQARWEEDNVKQCLNYGREQLGL